MLKLMSYPLGRETKINYTKDMPRFLNFFRKAKVSFKSPRDKIGTPKIVYALYAQAASTIKCFQWQIIMYEYSKKKKAKVGSESMTNK